MGDYENYEDSEDRYEMKMSYYERKKYDRQCREIGEDNMMPLFTGTEFADLFRGARL